MSHAFVPRAALVVMGAAALCLSAPRAHSQDFDPTPEPTPEPTYQYFLKAIPTPEGEELQAAPEPKATATPESKSEGSTMAVRALPSDAVIISVNDSSTTNDDMVAKDDSVHCLARLRDDQPADVTVVLTTDPSYRIRFLTPDGPQKQATIVLRADGSTTGFTISGAVSSNSANDVLIAAHRNYYNQPRIGTQTLSVYEFVNDKVSVEEGRNYVLFPNFPFNDGFQYTADGGQAVTMYARVSIKPSGLSLTSPKLDDVRLVLVQNMSKASFIGNGLVPKAVSWDKGLKRNATVRVPSAQGNVSGFNGRFLDNTHESALLKTYIYAPDTIARPNFTIRTIDTPSAPFRTEGYEVLGPVLETLATYHYTRPAAQFKATFQVYSILVHANGTLPQLGSSGNFPRRQTTWSLNLHSTAKTPQHARALTTDSAVTPAPVLSGTNANTELNRIYRPSKSSTMTTLTKGSPTGYTTP